MITRAFSPISLVEEGGGWGVVGGGGVLGIVTYLLFIPAGIEIYVDVFIAVYTPS